MDIRQLQAFAAVMSTGSITAAGQALGRSQPTITRLIQELEAGLGYALFLRQGPKVLPTEQGFLIYDDVMNALNGLNRVKQKAAALAEDGLSEPLRISATSALMCGLVPQALKALSPANERALLQSAAPEQVVHDVLSGAAHLGVSSLPLEHSGVKLHWIASAPCVVAVPSGSALAKKLIIKEADLLAYTPITMANPYRLRQRLSRALPRFFKQSALIETNSSVNALCAVQAGLGVAVLEPLTSAGIHLSGVSLHRLEQTIPFYFGVMSLQGRQLSSTVQAVIDSLKSTASGINGFQLHRVSQYREILHELHTNVSSNKVLEE